MAPERIPARTTLRIIDFGFNGDDHIAYALTPDGRHVVVARATIRDHGYLPRTRPERRGRRP